MDVQSNFRRVILLHLTTRCELSTISHDDIAEFSLPQ
jgi:hypothetical protein